MTKTLPKLALFFFVPCAGALAQVVPAASSPSTLALSGILRYNFRYAQAGQFGGASLGDWNTSTLSASLGYANEKERLPFTLDYIGGYTWTLAGSPYATGFFQHLLLSQGVAWRKWHVKLSDDASYRPQAPTTGFSGISGIGEPIGEPIPSLPSSQSILTLNTHAVDNLAHGEIDHMLNDAFSLNAGGTSELLRYPDDNGLNTDTLTSNGGLTWYVNKLNFISGNYMFSHFTYPDYNFGFTSNSALFGFNRNWNREITTTFSAGPQWTHSSDDSIVPPSVGVAVNAEISRESRFESASLFYSRATTGGAGYLFGAETDSVNAHFSRHFGRNLNLGVEGSYPAYCQPSEQWRNQRKGWRCRGEQEAGPVSQCICQLQCIGSIVEFLAPQQYSKRANTNDQFRNRIFASGNAPKAMNFKESYARAS